MNGYNEEQNNEYMSSGKKRKSHIGIIIFISMILLGIIVAAAGAIWAYNTDMTKYMKVKSVDETFDAENVKNVSVDYVCGNLIIEKSNDDNIHVYGTNVPEYVEFDLNENGFEVKSVEHNGKVFWENLQVFNWNFDRNNNGTLTVSLPQKSYDRFVLNLGAGKTDISDISCKNSEIDMGAGQTTVTNLSVSEFIDIDCGVGQVNFNNGYFGSADIDCGVGEFNFTGMLKGKTDIDCGVGACNFNIFGNKSDYTFTGDNYGERSHSGTSGKYIIDVDSGVGEVNFSFSDSMNERNDDYAKNIV